ncbi:MAG: hypothetical protein CCU26_11895 [Nitrospira sp. UW-LDO-01]|nr:MAG: hypothetical protein CCU26_11895 [Nitrospira sp. UW-LDO-01]
MVRWMETKAGWRMPLLGAGCLLLAGMIGCGSPASDKPADAELHAANGKPEDRKGAVQPIAGKSGPNETPPTKAASSAGTMTPSKETGSAGATPLPTMIPRDDDDRLNIPDPITKGLGSSDARDRYRALDYWEKKDSKAPMDPVFDALADDDPAVRDKAAAIIDKLVEAGEERE